VLISKSTRDPTELKDLVVVGGGNSAPTGQPTFSKNEILLVRHPRPSSTATNIVLLQCEFALHRIERLECCWRRYCCPHKSAYIFKNCRITTPSAKQYRNKHHFIRARLIGVGGGTPAPASRLHISKVLYAFADLISLMGVCAFEEKSVWMCRRPHKPPAFRCAVR
jgi:hypothetical protein